MQPDSIAILGGGLTGLSAAFHLSRRFPTACITLINNDTRFGGWVRSERVEFKYTTPSGTQEEANVLFETGPRVLRPGALSVLELVRFRSLVPQCYFTMALVDIDPSFGFSAVDRGQTFCRRK